MREMVFTVFIPLLVACSDPQSAVDDEKDKDLVVDMEYYDSLNNLHEAIISRIEVEGELLPVNKIAHFSVFQSISTESLGRDTLRVMRDASWWAHPDSTESIDARYWFQYDIALHDIDTGNISGTIVDDVLWINIPVMDTLDAVWGKFDTKLNRWRWKVPSNEVRLGYLVCLDKIDNSFKYYRMYEPGEGSSIDYTTSSMDSVHASRLYSEIRSIIIGYAQK